MSRSLSKSHAPSHRVERVGELIRHAVADILARGEVRDDALDRHPLTIPDVRMSPDLKLATILVMPLGGKGAGRGDRGARAPQKGIAHARRAPGQSQVRSRSAFRPGYELRGSSAHGRASEIARGRPGSEGRRRRGRGMTGDAREDRQPGAESARSAARASRGRSDRPGSISTDGSISTSRLAFPRLKPSGDSSFCSTRRKRATPERLIRSRRACCRSRSAKRQRPCRSFRMAPNPTGSACAGERKARPMMPKGRSSHVLTGARPGRNRKPPAALRRRDSPDAADLFRDPHRWRTRLRSRTRRRNIRD